jgi:hypothetical protein
VRLEGLSILNDGSMEHLQSALANLPSQHVVSGYKSKLAGAPDMLATRLFTLTLKLWSLIRASLTRIRSATSSRLSELFST